MASPAALSGPAGTLGAMTGHLVTIDTANRPDYAGRVGRRYLCRCRCGWSEGWLFTRTEAEQVASQHTSAASVALLKGPPPAA